MSPVRPPPPQIWPTCVPVKAFHADPLTTWWLPGLRIVAHQGAVNNQNAADQWTVMTADGRGPKIPGRWWPRSRVTLVGLVEHQHDLPDLWVDNLPHGTPLWWQPPADAG